LEVTFGGTEEEVVPAGWQPTEQSPTTSSNGSSVLTVVPLFQAALGNKNTFAYFDGR
jgi:hypothetical protein